MARKKKEPEQSGCPLWVVTFGDAMSLLVTFFVMLVSFADYSEDALNEVFGAMKGGLSAISMPLARAMNQVDYSAGDEGLPASAGLSKESDSYGAGQGGDVMEPQVADSLQYNSAEYYIQMLENGMSLVINQQSAFEYGTANLVSTTGEIWELASALMRIVDKEVRITVVIPSRAAVLIDGYSTAWGLGIEQALVVKKHMTTLAGRDPGMVSTAVRVVEKCQQIVLIMDMLRFVSSEK
jgi:chemotaxis protein MotB